MDTTRVLNGGPQKPPRHQSQCPLWTCCRSETPTGRGGAEIVVDDGDQLGAQSSKSDEFLPSPKHQSVDSKNRESVTPENHPSSSTAPSPLNYLDDRFDTSRLSESAAALGDTNFALYKDISKTIASFNRETDRKIPLNSDNKEASTPKKDSYLSPSPPKRSPLSKASREDATGKTEEDDKSPIHPVKLSGSLNEIAKSQTDGGASTNEKSPRVDSIKSLPREDHALSGIDDSFLLDDFDDGTNRPMTISEYTYMRNDLSYLKVLIEQIAYFYKEEQLLKAWSCAEIGLDIINIYTKKVKAMTGADQKLDVEDITAEFLVLHKALADTDVFRNVINKFNLLKGVFEEFGLLQRFDIFTCCNDEAIPLVPHNRLYSTDLSPQIRALQSSELGFNQTTAYLDRRPSEVGASTTAQSTSRQSSLKSGSGAPRLSRLFGHRKKSNQKIDKNEKTQGGLDRSDSNASPRRRFLRRRRKRVRTGSGGPPPTVGETTAPVAPQAALNWHKETKGGLQMSHRVNHSDGTISVNIKAKMRIPLFKVLAILNETDYYDKWVPYCKTCENIGQLSRASMVLQQLCDYPWPIKMKENMSYCFGVDSLDEFGCVVIASCSPPDNATSFMGCQIPPPQKKVPRVPSSRFLFLLFPINGGKGTIVECFATVDPGVTALKSVLLPVARIVTVRSVRGFFYKIGQLATNFQSSGYEAKVNENREIYEWIQRRIDECVTGGRLLTTGNSMTTLLLDELKDGK